MDEIQQKLKDTLGNRLKTNEILASHVWFKIGGAAKYFFAPQNNDELIDALKIADELNLNTFLLGGGSNLLISDEGFDGFVIKPENNNFKIDGTAVYTEAGVKVIDLLDATLKKDLTGWAWAAGLPGTIGGAIRGNAGAYGKGMSDIVVWVDVYEDGEVKRYNNEQMKFLYRHSIAKEKKIIIIAAEITLEKGDIKADLEQVEAYNNRRQTTQPLECPNAGCIFKNVNLAEVEIDRERVIRELDISEEEFLQATKYNKLPVSFILDHLGLKGKKIGGAMISEKHGAFIVNKDNATAEHVIMLISEIKMRVRNRLGIQLQEEVQLVGF